MTVWRLDTGSWRFGKDAVKMVGNGTTGRYHQGKRRNANRGVEREAYEGAKGSHGEENIISAVIPRRRDNYLIMIFVPLTKRRSIGSRRDRRRKENAQDAEIS